MSDLSIVPPARLFTAFGTVLYVDVASGELRHGAVETSPANAVFVSDTSSTGPHRHGWLMYDAGDSREPVVCLADRSHSVSRTEGAGESDPPTVLELIALERGLITLKSGNLFLSAIPEGAISLSATRCSTWEIFLASEDWCTGAHETSEEQIEEIAKCKIDTKKIRSYLVHPLIRKRASADSKAKKILIYGYPQWSHGRVYYDLCKQLHRRGYIVDIVNWQVDHAAYIAELIPFYDLFMTALDGVRTLVDVYGVPYGKVIALSHHEFDMRMLIEQKGIEVFDKFASYGVVSEFLYSASIRLGVQRIPMVTSLGVNFAEFYAEVPERLATVGYAGSMSTITYGIEWKRGDLAEAATRDAELGFNVAGWTGNQITFHDMPEFYRSVDAILMSSISEGAGLPVMEAAAAGRLVIGTPVGHFPLKAYQGGGIIAPIEAEKFKNFTSATLRYYKENPTAYVDKCRTIQEAARKFDWQYTIGEWTELIEGAKECGDISGGTQVKRVQIGEGDALERAESQGSAVASPSGEHLAMIQQVHVINLDRSIDRFAKFKERNSNLESMLRVSAVDGALVNREELVTDGTISENLSYLPGSLGCALSHVDLWKKALSQNRIVTIMEDDVICSQTFRSESAQIVSRLPEEWDIILWGYNFYPLFMWLDIGVSKVKLESYDRRFVLSNCEKFQLERFSSTAVKIAHVFGTMAYSISPKGARQLLDRCLPLSERFLSFPGTGVVIKDTGIDCPMCAAYPSMQAFVCIPPLVIHDEAQMSDRIASGG